MRRSLLAVAGLLMLPAVTAQDVESGCVESAPCEWIIEVDDSGFDGSFLGLNGTSGDWYVLDVFNFGDAQHTVTLSGHPVEVVVDSVDSARSAPFQLGAAGSYVLADAPSGDAAPVEVLAGDAEATSDTSSTPKLTPGWTLPAGLTALLAGAWMRRR